MKILFWNIRGFGKAAHRRQIKDYISEEKLEIVALQKTIKQEFIDQELNDLIGGIPFQWTRAPAKGRSGGILMGAKLEEAETLEYCVVMRIRNRLTNFRFTVVTVYGPAQHEFSEDFLLEVDGFCDRESLPTVIGGDFNLVREAQDNNSLNVDAKLMDSFNNFIGSYQLRELARAGPRYTWTNKQGNPVLAKLDRILVSSDWEEASPYAYLGALLE